MTKFVCSILCFNNDNDDDDDDNDTDSDSDSDSDSAVNIIPKMGTPNDAIHIHNRKQSTRTITINQWCIKTILQIV